MIKVMEGEKVPFLAPCMRGEKRGTCPTMVKVVEDCSLPIHHEPGSSFGGTLMYHMDEGSGFKELPEWFRAGVIEQFAHVERANGILGMQSFEGWQYAWTMPKG